MLQILSVFGTRPEAIKMVPILRELRKHAGRVLSRVCVTAQHRHLLDQVLSLFGIVPDWDLDLMRDAQSPAQIAAEVLSRLGPILTSFRPDWVVVQGDTTTAVAASLAAFYAKARVAHVEAGLRTGDTARPFPEEANRRIVGVVADLHFAPTARARDNLLGEGIVSNAVILTGNTVVDALRAMTVLPCDLSSNGLASVPWHKRIILVTAHRRENFGRSLESICEALRDLAARFADSIHVVWPVHPNPNVWEPVHRALDDALNVTLIPPLEYLPFVHLLRRSYLVLTDSGGLQEEAPCFGKPVLVLRGTTERPETIQAGSSLLVGCERETIVAAATQLLQDPDAYRAMARVNSPFGDGRAAERIVDALLQMNSVRPDLLSASEVGEPSRSH